MMLSKLMLLSLVITTQLTTCDQAAQDSYKDLYEVVTRCQAKPKETYEQSCGSWYQKFKEQINQPIPAKDVDGYGAKMNTPLLKKAVGLRQLQAVLMLLNLGANVNGADAHGYTALHSAAFNNDMGTIKLLIQAGANVDSASKNGSTPLHQAIWYTAYQYPNGISAAQALLESGANVNAQESNGNTPLDKALSLAKTRTMKEPRNYRTPYDLDAAAAYFAADPVANLLVNHGGKLAYNHYEASYFSKCYWFGKTHCKLFDPTTENIKKS